MCVRRKTEFSPNKRHGGSAVRLSRRSRAVWKLVCVGVCFLCLCAFVRLLLGDRECGFRRRTVVWVLFVGA